MASTPIDHKNRRIALVAVFASLGMLGLGFAAVPLYDLFCRVTGFAGTTQVATETEAATAEAFANSAGAPTISIRFDANTAKDMPWEFRPRQVTDTVQIGQRDMAIYEATNHSPEPVTGVASFNVEPEQAGAYFNKIQCFCFTEQLLAAGEERPMPVRFVIDPDLPPQITTVTLSYTFFNNEHATSRLLSASGHGGSR